MSHDLIELVLNGGLMRGMRAHARLVQAGGQFLGETTTAPRYRLWSIQDQFPGMMRADPGGCAIACERYRVPPQGLTAILLREPHGLCLGHVELVDGAWVIGVVAEPWLTDGQREISSYGGWRAYVHSQGIAQTPLKEETAKKSASGGAGGS